MDDLLCYREDAKEERAPPQYNTTKKGGMDGERETV